MTRAILVTGAILMAMGLYVRWSEYSAGDGVHCVGGFLNSVENGKYTLVRDGEGHSVGCWE